MSSTNEDYVDAVDAVAVATDIVVAATAITNNADSDSSSDEVEACMVRRVSWPKINLLVRKNGKPVETHPFLNDNINERDRALVRILLDERPYAVGHGEVGLTWAVVMQKCNDLHDENGAKLFIPDLQEITTVQSRLKNYLTFTKKHQRNVPLRSGCEDEKPSNLLNLLHQLKDDVGTGIQETMVRRDARRKLATKKEAGRAAAIVLKDKSVKKIALKAALGDAHDGDDGDDDGRLQKKTKPNTGSVHNNIHVLAETGKARAEAKLAQAAAKLLSAQRKEKKDGEKNKYIQWRMDQVELDRAVRSDEAAARKFDAENRNMELKLKCAKRKLHNKETDDNEETDDE
jgi:hypothetical protein